MNFFYILYILIYLYIQENNTTEQPSKIYFNGDTLDEIINLYPITRKGLSQREIDKGIKKKN